MATEPKYDREELVSVFNSMEESEVMVVRGLLESNGIECLVTALDAPQDVLPGVGGMVVRVPADRALEARQIIEQEGKTPLADDADVSDQSAPEGPA